MAEVSFDELWESFHAYERESPFEVIVRVKKYLKGLDVSAQSRFLDCLVHIGLNGDHLALSILQSEAELKQLQAISEALKNAKMPHASDIEASALRSALIRIIAADKTNSFGELVEKYLLVEDIGLYWPNVPWALWPHNKNLFCKAWLRYVQMKPQREWQDTVIAQAFIGEIEALGALKEFFLKTSSSDWEKLRDAISLHKDASWLTELQKNALLKTLSK